MGPGVELLAVLVAQGAAVGEDVLVGGAADRLLGLGNPFLLVFVGSSTEGSGIEVLA